MVGKLCAFSLLPLHRLHKLPRCPPWFQSLYLWREPLGRLTVTDKHGDRHPSRATGHLVTYAPQATENVMPGGRGNVGLVLGFSQWLPLEFIFRDNSEFPEAPRGHHDDIRINGHSLTGQILKGGIGTHVERRG